MRVTGTGTIASPTPLGSREGYRKDDGDTDNDDPGRHDGKAPEEDNTALLAGYAARASRSARDFATGLVRRFYTAAASGDTVQVCNLLASTFVQGLSNAGKSGSCPSNVAPLLAAQRAHFVADEPATMRVAALYVNRDFGLALLEFKNVVERELLLQREKSSWKIGALFDGSTP